MHELTLSNITCSYGQHQVLTGVDCTISGGNLAFLLGPNGCGKSTLFSCILGHHHGHGGTVTIDGVDISHMSPAALAKLIAYIPQSSAPTFNYTVLQTVMMGRTSHMGLFASPSKSDMEIAIQSLERLGIGHLADKGANKISGGEQQLVLIARALAQQAPVIMMDEPTSNLDFGNQLMVLHQLRSLCRDGKLILLSSHNPQHALSYGDHVLVLHDGKIEQQGIPQQIITSECIKHVYGVDVQMLDYTDSHGHRQTVLAGATESF